MFQRKRNRDREATVYLDPLVYEEIRAEAKRLDRSVTWIMKKVWKRAKPQIIAERT